VSRYQNGKTNLDFTEARDSEWQWYQLGHMQVCTSPQTENHASTPPLRFLQAGCSSCRPTNSVHRKPCNLQSRSHTSVQASIRERSGWPSSLTGLNTPRIVVSRRLKRSTTSRPGQGTMPRSDAVPSLWLCLWPRPHQVHWRHARFLPKLSVSAWRQWAVSTHTEFMCLRESSDSANPFVSATAIQLTPKPYYNRTQRADR